MPTPDPQIRRRLLAWYARHGRVLPWRGERDPYKILVSEVMLQQTQVDRVIPFYEKFLNQFPTAKKLAAASPGSVIRLWGGLGYNRRALFLQKTAQAVVARGGWPKTIDDLLTLPGVGPYTSRALAAFALGQRVSVLDVNVRRWLQRLLFGPEHRSMKPEAVLQAVADRLVPPRQTYDWNQAVMDFGAMVCTAKKPACQTCPFAARCRSKQFFTDIPIVARKKNEKKIAFKDSTRFVRGRIVDALRRAPAGLTTVRLVRTIEQAHPHVPRQRIAAALSGLVRDQLITASRGRICLPRT